MTLNCITIDDEPLALGLINSYVTQTPFLRLLDSYATTSNIVSKLAETDFHLLFLDIHMPRINGIEIARAIREMNKPYPPKIIFTTAYNQFAVESYEVEALDYLLKPFEYEKFLCSATKAARDLEQDMNFQAQRVLHDEVLFVRSSYQQIRIPWHDIKYIQGLKDYVTIHLKSTDKSIIALATLKSLSDELPQDRFRRVQKSYIVALDAISSMSTNSLWIKEKEISIGEHYKEDLQAVFRSLQG